MYEAQGPTSSWFSDETVLGHMTTQKLASQFVQENVKLNWSWLDFGPKSTHD